MFKGSMVALITPFRDGSACMPKVDQLVEFHVDAGTDEPPIGHPGAQLQTNNGLDPVLPISDVRSGGDADALSQAGPSEPKQTVDEMRSMIADALAAADTGDGVLILTDMFGGTPSNISLSFLEEHRIEVVTGINLPMLIKLATLTEDKPVEELATFVKEYGQRNISVASELLPKEQR